MSLCITTVVDDSESDNELSVGEAAAITFSATFFITLIVTALFSIIITGLYYKYRYVLMEKAKQGDLNTKPNDPYGGNITMHANPTYTADTTIEMDINPADTNTN